MKEVLNMKLENVKNVIVAKKNGVFFRINYRTEIPVKAEFKKAGINLVKFTEKTVRTGVNYEHIQAVIDKKSAEDYVAPAHRENHKDWIVNNKLFYNTNTNKYYVRLAHCNGSKAKSKYVAYGADGNEIEFDKNYAVNSYWNKSNNDIKSVFDVNVDNIMSIA